MKIPWYWLLSVFCILAVAVVLNGLQTSFWYLLFGGFPPPLLWLVALVYMTVSRSLWEATLMIYLLTVVNSAFTVMPFEALLLFSVALTITLVLIRERVFWGGPTFFMLMVGAASLAAPIIYWLVSRWVLKMPTHLQIFDWLISMLLTVLFSLPLYQLYRLLDKLAEQGSGEGHIGPR